MCSVLSLLKNKGLATLVCEILEWPKGLELRFDVGRKVTCLLSMCFLLFLWKICIFNQALTLFAITPSMISAC